MLVFPLRIFSFLFPFFRISQCKSAIMTCDIAGNGAIFTVISAICNVHIENYSVCGHIIVEIQSHDILVLIYLQVCVNLINCEWLFKCVYMMSLNEKKNIFIEWRWFISDHRENLCSVSVRISPTNQWIDTMHILLFFILLPDATTTNYFFLFSYSYNFHAIFHHLCVLRTSITQSVRLYVDTIFELFLCFVCLTFNFHCIGQLMTMHQTVTFVQIDSFSFTHTSFLNMD